MKKVLRGVLYTIGLIAILAGWIHVTKAQHSNQRFDSPLPLDSRVQGNASVETKLNRFRKAHNPGFRAYRPPDIEVYNLHASAGLRYLIPGGCSWTAQVSLSYDVMNSGGADARGTLWGDYKVIGLVKSTVENAQGDLVTDDAKFVRPLQAGAVSHFDSVMEDIVGSDDPAMRSGNPYTVCVNFDGHNPIAPDEYSVVESNVSNNEACVEVSIVAALITYDADGNVRPCDPRH